MGQNYIYTKLHNARKFIKTKSTEKKGFNNHLNYKYYTPEQISELVFQACEDQKIMPLFSFKRNELGYYGVLLIHDLESDNFVTFEMSSDVPDLKASTSTQKLGGAVTYTERYLLMTAFDIKDNNLDLDSQQFKNKKNEKKLPELNPSDIENWNKVKKALLENYKMEQIKTKWHVSSENEIKLLSEIS